MGPIGVQEMIVIFLVALVLFGPKKLPELGKNLAKAMGEFTRAKNELKATFDREMSNLERETASAREAFQQASTEIHSYAEQHLLADPNSTHDGTSHDNSNAIADTALAHSSSPVGASEAASAELHAENAERIARQAQGTVARGSIGPAADAHPVEDNPLPELESGLGPRQGAQPGPNQELPSLV